MPTLQQVMPAVIRSNLESLMEEMVHLLYRSAFSTSMREARDCSYLVVDREGRVIAMRESLTHATTYPVLVKAIYERYGRDGLYPGDVIITNHPYKSGLPHTPDLAVVTPVFVNGELVAFSGSIAHKPDFGGAVPGSVSARMTELYQEGLLLPALKLYERGEFRRDVEDIIVCNVRDPDLFLGDMRAQIGVTRVGGARLEQLFTRYGTETVQQAFEALLDTTEARLTGDHPPVARRHRGGRRACSTTTASTSIVRSATPWR